MPSRNICVALVVSSIFNHFSSCSDIPTLTSNSCVGEVNSPVQQSQQNMASDRGGGDVGYDWGEDDKEDEWDVEDEGDTGDWQEFDVGCDDINQAAGYQLASQEDDGTTMEREDDCQITSSPPFPCTDDLACFDVNPASIGYKRSNTKIPIHFYM